MLANSILLLIILALFEFTLGRVLFLRVVEDFIRVGAALLKFVLRVQYFLFIIDEANALFSKLLVGTLAISLALLSSLPHILLLYLGLFSCSFDEVLLNFLLHLLVIGAFFAKETSIRLRERAQKSLLLLSHFILQKLTVKQLVWALFGMSDWSSISTVLLEEDDLPRE